MRTARSGAPSTRLPCRPRSWRRIDGQAAAVETPIGHVPAPGSLDVEGLDLTDDQLAQALAVDVEEWKAELPQIEEWFEKFGDDLPAVLWSELDTLKARLDA